MHGRHKPEAPAKDNLRWRLRLVPPVAAPQFRLRHARPHVDLDDRAQKLRDLSATRRAPYSSQHPRQDEAKVMGTRQTGTLLRHLRQLLVPEAVKDQTDAELLLQFAALRDEVAFSALVHRHGREVWSVCRHVLRNDEDAEDAFQATFLVLARKAGSVRNRTSVRSWLYGVAYRTAQKARVAAARRRKHEA